VTDNQTLDIFIVSNATGTTAESVVTAVLVQFKKAEFNIRRFSFTRTRRQIDEILDQTPESRCIIVFTLVSEKLRNRLVEKGTARNLTVIDVMGPLISTLANVLSYSPKMQPGVFRHQAEDMLQVVEAINYTLAHDDGLRMETINEADLIILGVSRTGKTPTSIFLSCRKLKVANIPIIGGVPFPKKIAQLPVKKVGFLIDLERLYQLRFERARSMARTPVPGYSSKAAILEEQEYCHEVFSSIPMLRTLDITNLSVEEISRWITQNVL